MALLKHAFTRTVEVMFIVSLIPVNDREHYQKRPYFHQDFLAPCRTKVLDGKNNTLPLDAGLALHKGLLKKKKRKKLQPNNFMKQKFYSTDKY
jgi:hypothetical protein